MTRHSEPRPATLLGLLPVVCALLIFWGPMPQSTSQTEPTAHLISAVRHSEPAPGVPSRIRIPRLQMDAPVVPVGLEHDGTMGIPQSAEEVGWFSPGVKPGMAGNAILAGHLDTVLGTPGVFSRIEQLQPGDPITVQDIHSMLHTFRVLRTDVYPQGNAPLRQIFGSASGAQLRLITCHGSWNGRTYNQRLVVTAVQWHQAVRTAGLDP